MPYPSPQELVVVREAEKLMEETMARYDPSHDAHHVQRVRRTAMHIAKQMSETSDVASRKPDLLVVEVAALLHDVLDKKYVSPAEAANPDAYFSSFFVNAAKEGGVDLLADGRAKVIVKIIENVSWSTEQKLSEAGRLETWHRDCVELHCVQDADRLDAIGAFGIMRCAAFSTVSKRPLHTPEDDQQHNSTAIQHFHDKLLHIQQRLKTDVGRQLSVKRHELMLNFLAAVGEEYNLAA